MGVIAQNFVTYLNMSVLRDSIADFKPVTRVQDDL